MRRSKAFAYWSRNTRTTCGPPAVKRFATDAARPASSSSPTHGNAQHKKDNKMSKPVKVAIIGSGNIGTDLMIKILRHGKHLKMGAMVGIDPASDGLARAERLGVPTTANGIDGLVALPNFSDIRIAFDATSAGAHHHHAAVLREHGVTVIDLTPAAIGPFVVPVVNLFAHL